ncbi:MULTISPECIES: hypothetical protein [Methanocalculus]|nr:hypothetical protein [Methanocalculus sp. AMF5]MCP1662610.1 hypothetical protein [Methanocalculus sp. AMF5]
MGYLQRDSGCTHDAESPDLCPGCCGCPGGSGELPVRYLLTEKGWWLI